MAHSFHCLLTSDLCPVCFLSLQRQVAGEVQTQPQDRTVNQIAMMLAIMGLSLSYYSAKQMTEKVQAQPAPWRGLTTLIAEIMDEPMSSEGGGARGQKQRHSSVFQGHTFLTSVIFTLRHWISGIPHSPCAEISGLLLSVFYTFCCRVLQGFVGMVHLGSCLRLVQVGDQNQQTAYWVWPLVVTKVHACKMPSILFWATKTGNKIS